MEKIKRESKYKRETACDRERGGGKNIGKGNQLSKKEMRDEATERKKINLVRGKNRIKREEI